MRLRTVSRWRRIVVLEPYQFAVCELAAVVDAGVVGPVDNGDRALVDEGRDGTEVRQVAGGEDDGGFLAHEPSDPVLEFLVKMGAAVEQARAGHRSAVLEDRVFGGVNDVRVAGQAEVVVRAEHEHPLAIDLPFGAVVAVQGLEEGIDVEIAGLIDEREGVGLGEDVALVLTVEVGTHEPFDRDVGGEFGQVSDAFARPVCVAFAGPCLNSL